MVREVVPYRADEYAVQRAVAARADDEQPAGRLPQLGERRSGVALHDLLLHANALGHASATLGDHSLCVFCDEPHERRNVDRCRRRDRRRRVRDGHDPEGRARAARDIRGHVDGQARLLPAVVADHDLADRDLPAREPPRRQRDRARRACDQPLCGASGEDPPDDPTMRRADRDERRSLVGADLM
jgi:hypothetical protein